MTSASADDISNCESGPPTLQRILITFRMTRYSADLPHSACQSQVNELTSMLFKHLQLKGRSQWSWGKEGKWARRGPNYRVPGVVLT